MRQRVFPTLWVYPYLLRKFTAKFAVYPYIGLKILNFQ